MEGRIHSEVRNATAKPTTAMTTTQKPLRSSTANPATATTTKGVAVVEISAILAAVSLALAFVSMRFDVR